MIKTLSDSFFGKAPVPFCLIRVLSDALGKTKNHSILEANAIFLKLFNLSQEMVIGKRLSDLLFYKNQATDFWEQLFDDSHSKQFNLEKKTDDLTPETKLHVWIFPLEPGFFGCVIRDVTTEVYLENEFEAFLEISVDMFCMADPDGYFLKVNKRFEEVLGYSIEELENKNFFAFIHDEDKAATLGVMNQLKEQKEISHYINRYRCKGGTYKNLEWRAVPKGYFFYASARDVTDMIKKEESLRNAAIIDPLTGLYNRNFFYGRVFEEISKSQTTDVPLSMIAIDIDHFKFVNDIWGHPVGDEILERTARFLKSTLRLSDVISRVGGEEFVVLLPNTQIDEAMNVAKRMFEILNNTPHPRVGKITASFGVAERHKNEDFNQWYKRADDAMYVAKDRGRNTIVSAGDTAKPVNASIYLEWKEEWNCGEPTIDGQHRELVEIGNKLIFLTVSGASPQSISDQIDHLMLFVANHFSAEEQITSKLNFPDFEQHQKIHQSLLIRAGEISSGFLKDHNKSPISLAFIINDLIVGHLINDDRKFFSYIPKT